MKRKWNDPPNWDKHLDEAIEEVNAIAPAVEDIVAAKSWPESEGGMAETWLGVWAFCVCTGLFWMLVDLTVAVLSR